MARRRQVVSTEASGASGTAQYVALEARLVLLAWLNRQFGYESNREMLADLKKTEEGFDSDGRSYIYHRLLSRGSKVEISQDDLTRYDDNIRKHLNDMNNRRSDPIVLRYFQYAAAFYTECFLDWYFRRRSEMIHSLNLLVDERNATDSLIDLKNTRFSEADLGKLAFWMATGSGKTLIMHLNYYQFLHYNDQPLDNILLITLNEGLSEQHISEMKESGIACRRFDLGTSGLAVDGRDTVQVIEITKLVQNKRGSGVSVPVEAFEGNNLIFVDEGHKGARDQAWRNYRDELGQIGFTFEYSATFGQALKAADDDLLTEEYGKAIAFDYSYFYFYRDGYGKDFRILNLKDETAEDGTRMLLLGNLLSFYEQRRMFEEQEKTLRPYNLERPLWLFVGGTVNKNQRSDVLAVVRFLHGVLKNQDGQVVADIEKLLDGNTGLTTPDGRDVFDGRFQYLLKSSMKPDQLYRDILVRVFHAPASGGLHLSTIRGSTGEIGLRTSGAEDYFGLIYIGDTSEFKKLVEQDDSGIVLEEDVIGDSLFAQIGAPDTTIDVLVGAKKFIEGWNSWRVSAMGLLNIGRSEGSQIIQLFGRGVRLRGWEFGLKRSVALDGNHPRYVRLLETLNVFAVRADYMSKFREYLEKEGVEPEGTEELPLRIKPNKDFLNQGLVVPRVPEDETFSKKANLLLRRDEDIPPVRVDLSPRVQELASGFDLVSESTVYEEKGQSIPEENLDLVDWEQVYLELLAYKERKGLVNIVVRPEAVREIMTARGSSRAYNLIAGEAVTNPQSFEDAGLLHKATVSITRKYLDRFHRVRWEAWETKRMNYKEIDQNDANFHECYYTVKVDRKDPELIQEIQKLIDQEDAIFKKDTRELPNIHFDRHLYQPLLIEKDDKVKSSPPGLNESERKFVDHLREYCKAEKDKKLAGKEIYLLRNLGRGRGIGFFETRGFYPDFILWIVSGNSQRIVFVEPHGMFHAKPYQEDHKARLHEALPELARAIEKRTKDARNVSLDSFIISATPYATLRDCYDDGNWDIKRFTEAHILFFDRYSGYDYLAFLMGLADPKDFALPTLPGT